MFLFSTSYIWKVLDVSGKKFKLGEWEREQTLSGSSSHPAFWHPSSVAVLSLWFPCFSTSIVVLFITKLKSPLLFWILSRDQTPGEHASTEQCTQCHRPQPGQVPLCAGSVLAPQWLTDCAGCEWTSVSSDVHYVCVSAPYGLWLFNIFTS